MVLEPKTQKAQQFNEKYSESHNIKLYSQKGVATIISHLFILEKRIKGVPHSLNHCSDLANLAKG